MDTYSNGPGSVPRGIRNLACTFAYALLVGTSVAHATDAFERGVLDPAMPNNFRSEIHDRSDNVTIGQHREHSASIGQRMDHIMWNGNHLGRHLGPGTTDERSSDLAARWKEGERREKDLKLCRVQVKRS